MQQQTPTVNYTRRKCAKLGVIFFWLYLPYSPQKISEVVDKYYEKYYAMVKPDYDWNIQPESPKEKFFFNYRNDIKIAINIMSPEYHKIHEIYLKNLTLRIGSRLLIAIKQYKNENSRWPDSLDNIKSLVPAKALIDPAGGSFDYKNHGENFSLCGKLISIWPQ